MVRVQAGKQRTRLRRPGQMHIGADPLQLLGPEPPARPRLQRHLEFPALKAGQELPDPGHESHAKRDMHLF